MSFNSAFRRDAPSAPSSGGKGFRIHPDDVQVTYSPTSVHQQRFNDMLDAEYSKSTLSPASRYKIYEHPAYQINNAEDEEVEEEDAVSKNASVRSPCQSFHFVTNVIFF